MLKKKALRKIFITTFTVFVLLTIYLIPTNKNDNNYTYRYRQYESVKTFLTNENNQLVMVDVLVEQKNTTGLIREIIEKLTISNDATIPLGFERLIPSDVKLNDVTLNNDIAKLTFSEEFLNIDKDILGMVIESISYSVLSLKDINGLSIYVNNENISKIYKDIPDIIKSDFGINKRINIKGKDLADLKSVVIYYIDNVNDKNYYVPITKYVNDKRDKIKIIIDELSSSYIFEPNLITLLNKNIKLLDYDIKEDVCTLNFNNSIFMSQDSILEEVVYAISYSIFSNYNDVKEVVFMVDNLPVVTKTNE